MYSIEQAIRIALLENTSVTEDAIKSVIAAVKGLTAEVIDMNELTLKGFHDTYVKTFGPLDPNITGNDIDWHINDMIGEHAGPVRAWIIEKVGHPVSMTHYATVAESKRSCGFTVTAHHSRVTV